MRTVVRILRTNGLWPAVPRLQVLESVDRQVEKRAAKANESVRSRNVQHNREAAYAAAVETRVVFGDF